MGVGAAVPATLVTGVGAATAELRLAILAGTFALVSALRDRAQATRRRGSTLTRRPSQAVRPSGQLTRTRRAA